MLFKSSQLKTSVSFKEMHIAVKQLVQNSFAAGFAIQVSLAIWDFLVNFIIVVVNNYTTVKTVSSRLPL